MNTPSIKDLNKARNHLLKKIEKHSNFARGSITSVCAACSRASCICQNKTTRRAYRLTYKDNQQKTRIVYIPKGQLTRIKKMIENHKQLRATIEQLVDTNIEIFKREANNPEK